MQNKVYCSRAYWDNYIDSIVSSINEDRDTIVDMLMYGELCGARITMNLMPDRSPSYTIKVDKNCKKSPFEVEDDE
jgi:hypothetical protein